MNIQHTQPTLHQYVVYMTRIKTKFILECSVANSWNLKTEIKIQGHEVAKTVAKYTKITNFVELKSDHFIGGKTLTTVTLLEMHKPCSNFDFTTPKKTVLIMV